VTVTLAAITRDSVANYVSTLVYVYLILIFIRILMSWLPRVPYSRPLDLFLPFVRDVVDPYLNIFRRMVPMARVGGAGIDFSPILGSFVLIILGRIVVNLIRG
jgi:YggT family protein